MKNINEALLKVNRRVRLLRAWRGLALGALSAAVADIALAGMDFFGRLFTTWFWLGFVLLVGAALGATIGALLPINRMHLADSIDRRAGLKNRLRTAIEKSGSEEDFDAATVNDATSHLKDINARAAYPFLFTKWHASAVFCLALASVLFLLGNSSLLLNQQQKADREELRASASVVERIAKPALEKADKQDAAAERELAERLERFAQELKKGRMPKQDALMKANELANDAERLAKERFEKAEQSLLKADTALDKLEKDRLEAAGLKDANLSKAKQSKEDLEAESAALKAEESKLRKELANARSEQAKADIESKLAQNQEAQKQLELSKKAQDFLNRLQSQKEFQELMKLAQKANKLAESGKQGQPNLTEEQVKELNKQLEELADRLKNQEDLKQFIEDLKNSLKDCEGG